MEECMWCFTVPLVPSKVNRFIDLSSTDQYYFDHPHRRQCIALRFAHMLDPTLLIRCLHAAIEKFPKVGSRVVSYEGRLKFQLETEQTKLRLIIVQPKFIEDIFDWRRIFFLFSDRADQGHKSLFHAFLMRAPDASHGCVLMAGFEHCLGDAASYAMFIAAWSDAYRNQLLRGASLSPLTDIPPGVFSSAEEGDECDGLSSDRTRPDPRRVGRRSACPARARPLTARGGGRPSAAGGTSCPPGCSPGSRRRCAGAAATRASAPTTCSWPRSHHGA